MGKKKCLNAIWATVYHVFQTALKCTWMWFIIRLWSLCHSKNCLNITLRSRSCHCYLVLILPFLLGELLQVATTTGIWTTLMSFFLLETTTTTTTTTTSTSGTTSNHVGIFDFRGGGGGGGGGLTTQSCITPTITCRSGWSSAIFQEWCLGAKPRWWSRWWCLRSWWWWWCISGGWHEWLTGGGGATWHGGEMVV